MRLKKQTPPLAEPSVGAIRRIGAFARLTAAPVKATTFIDTDVDLEAAHTAAGEPVYERKLNLEQFDASGRPYRFAVFAYRIRAVDSGWRRERTVAAVLHDSFVAAMRVQPGGGRDVPFQMGGQSGGGYSRAIASTEWMAATTKTRSRG